MKLSMHILADELYTPQNKVRLPETNDGRFDNIKILTPNEEFEDDTVYLCTAERFLRFVEAYRQPLIGRSFILICDEIPIAILDALPIYYIAVQSDEQSFIYYVNRVDSIFTSYDEWETGLYSIFSDKNSSVQDLLEHIYIKIPVPMCVLNPYHNVIAITDRAKTDDPVFKEMINGYSYYSNEIIKCSNPKLTDFFNTDVIDVINDISGYRLRVYAIRHNRQIIGYLGLHKTDKAYFEPSVLELVDVVLPLLQDMIIMRKPGDVLRSDLFDQLMGDLISNKIMDLDLFEKTLNSFGLERMADYTLLAIKPSTRIDREYDLIFRAMDNAEKLLKGSKFFFLENYIGIIIKDFDFKKHMGDIQTIIDYSLPFPCVTGPTVSDFLNISHVWKLVKDALNNDFIENCKIGNTDKALVRMSRKAVSERLPKACSFHPDFDLLAQYDRENQTEYCSTLACYLQHNCSLVETSEVLFIHRNSLKYRIKKIEELLCKRIATCEDKENLVFASYFYDIFQG